MSNVSKNMRKQYYYDILYGIWYIVGIVYIFGDMNE